MEKVALEPVLASSNIGAAGYDRARQILAVQFRTDHAIRYYFAVPQEVASAFYGAESKGKFFHGKIRGKFRGERVSGPCRNCRAEGYVGELCAKCGTAKIFGVARKELEPGYTSGSKGRGNSGRGRDGAGVNLPRQGSTGAGHDQRGREEGPRP